MRKIMSVAAALLAIIGGALLATPAAAAPPPSIPPDVAAWFEQQAPRILQSQTLQNPQATPDPERLTFPYGSTLGKLTPVMVWDDAFVDAATPTADMLVPLGNWMAPIVAAGQPVGTFTVDDSNGTPEWMANADVDAAALMLSLKAGDLVVTDGHSGFFVVSGKTAHQAGVPQYGIPPATGTLQQLQGALRQMRSEIAEAVAANHGRPVAGGFTIDLAAYINSGVPGAQTSPPPLQTIQYIMGAVVVCALACAVGAGLLIRNRRKTLTEGGNAR